MNCKQQIFRFIISCLFIFSGCFQSTLVQGTDTLIKYSSQDIQDQKVGSEVFKNVSQEILRLNESLKTSLSVLISSGDSSQSKYLVEKIIKKTNTKNIDDSVLSESNYLLGIYYLLTNNFNKSIRFLNLCISFKEKKSEFDERYAKALYNIGLCYLNLGDSRRHEEYSLKSLEIERKINGNSSPLVFNTYLSLSVAYVNLKEYEKGLNYLNTALSFANSNPDIIEPLKIADLYSDIGGCYVRLADYSKAKIYLDKAESMYLQFNFSITENYINLVNNLALTYGALKLTSAASDYYNRVIPIAIANNSPLAFNIINSYAVFLANSGKAKQGDELLKAALDRANKRSVILPRNYIEVLINYANYLRDYKIDNKKALEYYEKCFRYLERNQQDNYLKTSASIGYSLSLDAAGAQEKALKTIQTLLLTDQQIQNANDYYANPGIDSLEPDKTTLRIIKAKYKILWDMYKKSGDDAVLRAASNTSELIIALLEKLRINISEDDSRLILGDKNRDSYLNAIQNFNLLYTKTKDSKYLEKAFEYSEKSKVEGLLTSARELKATQLNIPSDIGDYEKKLQGDLNLFNVRLAEETSKEKPDSVKMNKWKEDLLRTTRSRDSLILIFEKQFPAYYTIKYNTHAAEFKDIPSIIGLDGNYVNYILSDTTLYTFVVNKDHQQLYTIPVDSSFFNDIRKFRSLLSMPLPSDNASLKFREFQNVGYRLYKTLIDPMKSSLISEKLFIAPDNILSYIPFETIPTSPESQNKIRYRDLSYVMNSYDISYTYSATFLAESGKKEFSRSNTLIAFAPDYPEPIDIQSALMSRQAGMGVLNDLPFARQEAKYVSDITGGTLFENSAAKESVYKKESGKYDIIHLAMHTLLNDKEPMRSTLIFSHVNDSLEDGYLKTYEIYGIPLKAKMVVLSSCNTGTGLLYSGEGILSLARGFIYSGSRSVVMSMWEIEDKSGTDIVEMFYNYLKKGYPKSVALKKARIAFLGNADQLRSHPYFWSALVVYGDNTPLYPSSRLRLVILSIALMLLISSGYFYWKRKYS